ncbi:MAG TPA: serine protease [Puia sp.]|nr:serine protease [Puia sp.]
MLNKYIILLFSCIISTNTYAQISLSPVLLTQPALTGTLELKYKGGTATSFQYKGLDSIGYLITAKHIFTIHTKKKIVAGETTKYHYYDSIPYADGDKVEVQIYYSGNWHNIAASIYFDNDKNDVAVLKTDIPMGGNNYNLGNSPFSLSQECFFIGYPLGLRQSAGPSPYPMPFVRKGIISAFGDVENGIIPKFYIDGHNTYGFSGGPLLCYDYSKKEFFVVGVISGYIPQQNHQLKDDGTEQIIEENSGLMEIYNIEFVKRILKRLKCM